MSEEAPVTYGVVLLTMGKRPVELARGLESLLAQDGVALDIVVVGNSWEPAGLPQGVKAHHLPENLGIPAGRNAGVEDVAGEFLFFLDDDAWLPDPGFLRECARRLRADPGLGLIQPRIVDPDRRGEEPARWIPRIRKGDPARSSPAFSLMEMAVVTRRDVFEAAGGWPGEFFYAHEGIELAWRVWDTGHRTEYHGDLEAAHPWFSPTRHPEYYYMNARNRVWLARRCLRWPFSWAYVANWTLIQLARTRDRSAMRTWWKGWFDGWRKLPWAAGKRPRKLSVRTIVRMARHGRPPVI